MNEDRGAHVPNRKAHNAGFPLAVFLQVALYLCAVLSVVAAVAAMTYPELDNRILVFGLGLISAIGCCVTAEVAKLLLPTDGLPP